MIGSSVFDENVLRRLSDGGVIVVLVIDRAGDAVSVARALLDGGVTSMELTLRTPAALDALKEIRRHVPEMLAGVGTILTVDQVAEVAGAGASFGVAPGMNRKVVEAAITAGLSFAPGVVTPSDIEQALECGCRFIKFFPAEPSGGLTYLRSMAAPYEHLRLQFVPLGGVNLSNMRSYLEDPLIAAIGGSWIAPRKLIQDCQWAKITENARLAMEIVKQTKAAR